jgi:hypothetical protein
MCRRPSASPRSDGPNHATTARPLAAFALEPKAPASARAAPSAKPEPAREARTSAPAAPVSPTAMTARSPIRSASAPHASSVARIPIVGAASSAPVWASDTPSSARISGATAGSPSWSAEMLAWAVMPTASTTQR